MAFVEAGGGAAMSIDDGREPFYDPEDLLDELDSIIRDQAMLDGRTAALRARYAALEAFGERYDEPGDGPYSFPKEYGRVNIEFAAKYLDDASRQMQGVATYGLNPARELAAKVREYPTPEHEQTNRDSGNAIADAVARSADRDGAQR
ncbi:hypothetical protein [Nocardia fluminea]|uniref:hypothetical protein n=1 Tax=Nocardia fluminea TaxID=134984 RepID=UPI003418A512